MMNSVTGTVDDEDGDDDAEAAAALAEKERQQEEELHEIQAVFKQFDADHSGSIDLEEMVKAMAIL